MNQKVQPECTDLSKYLAFIAQKFTSTTMTRKINHGLDSIAQLIMDAERSARMHRLQKISNTAIRSTMKEERSILEKWNGQLLNMDDTRWRKNAMDTARYEEKRYNFSIMENYVEDFMGSKNMGEVRAEERHFWYLGMNARLLAV